MTRVRFMPFLLLGVFVAVGGTVLYHDALQNTGGQTAPMVSAAATNIPKTPARTAPEGFREYRSARYGFALFYPESMGVTEQDEGQGATTITFEDAAAQRGFQIFVVPYNETSISEERFLSDVSSGVRESERAIEVGGVSAMAFQSTDEFIGETTEVWVIANTHLYELTAPSAFAPDIDGIITSWIFTD
jgi:hypothetical protein